MRRQPPVLAGQELETMKVVWDLGSCTVREVYETLRTRRQIAYTTVMTTMRILAEMVREFVDRVFGGAAEPLVQHLVRDRHLTEDDLREIARQLKARKGNGDER